MDQKLYKWFGKQKKTNIIKVKTIDISKIKDYQPHAL